jgi:hypothetical protein
MFNSKLSQMTRGYSNSPLFIHYLVGGIPTPRKNMRSAVGMTILNISKNNPTVPVTTNQILVGDVSKPSTKIKSRPSTPALRFALSDAVVLLHEI